jgi:hypothetical protein
MVDDTAREMLALVKLRPDRSVVVLDFRPNRQTAFPQLPSEEEQELIDAIIASAPESFASDWVYELAIRFDDGLARAEVKLLRNAHGVFLAATALLESDGTVTVSNLYCDTPIGKQLPVSDQHRFVRDAVQRAFASMEVGLPQKIYLSLAEVFAEDEG